MSEKNLLSTQGALPSLLKIIEDFPDQIIPINKGRYCIITFKKQEPVAFCIKTEPFFNFGEKFKGQGAKGVGDSINCKDLALMKAYNVKWIYTMFRNGFLYKISLDEFLKNSFKWIQKEGTEVRSISIHLYERVNE